VSPTRPRRALPREPLLAALDFRVLARGQAGRQPVEVEGDEAVEGGARAGAEAAGRHAAGFEGLADLGVGGGADVGRRVVGHDRGAAVGAAHRVQQRAGQVLLGGQGA
jgi:hypothetical protein